MKILVIYMCTSLILSLVSCAVIATEPTAGTYAVNTVTGGFSFVMSLAVLTMLNYIREHFTRRVLQVAFTLTLITVSCAFIILAPPAIPEDWLTNYKSVLMSGISGIVMAANYGLYWSSEERKKFKIRKTTF